MALLQESVWSPSTHCARDVKLYFNYRSDETKVWDNESLRMLNSFYTIYPKKKDEGVALSLE
jgi:hypothetical protein